MSQAGLPPAVPFRDTLQEISRPMNVDISGIQHLITADNFQDVVELIRSDQVTTGEKQKFFNETKAAKQSTKLIFDSPLLAAARAADRMETLQMKAPVDTIKSKYKCKKCGSDRTYTSEKQTRSLDEGATVKVKCTNCGAES